MWACMYVCVYIYNILYFFIHRLPQTLCNYSQFLILVQSQGDLYLA